jgi:hypothetical protein
MQNLHCRRYETVNDNVTYLAVYVYMFAQEMFNS